MSSLDKKREEFHKYLDNAGAIDSLTKALIRLYEQKNKPQDAVKFLRKEMCEMCHDEEEYEMLAADLQLANKKICDLERELSRMKGTIKRSASEIDLAVIKGFEDMQVAPGCDSILKKLLTKEIISELKEAKTSFKGILLDCVQSGFEVLDSKVGIYACDPEAYTVFALLFDPLIEGLHDFKADDKHPDVNYGELCQLPDLDENFVKLIEVSCSRNVAQFPFAAIMTIEQYEEIMAKLSNTTQCMCNSDLKGTLYPLEGISDSQRKMLCDEKFAFNNDDKELKAANACRFWPTGRAIYVNDAKTFYIWCNQEDHFKFIARNRNGNLRSAYDTFINAVTQISKDIAMMRDERLGFLTFSPMNLGNSIRATIHVELKKLPKAKLDEIAREFNMRVMKIAVDDDESDNDVYEVTNLKTLGVTEFETVKGLADGINALINAEKSMA